MIKCDISFEATWNEFKYPDPRTENIDELKKGARQAQKLKKREIKQMVNNGYPNMYRFLKDLEQKYFKKGKKHQEKSSSNLRWKWYDPRYLIATALGASEPEWDAKTYSWWLKRDDFCFDVESINDVDKIKIPDWGNLPQIEKMLQSKERWKRAFPDSDTSSIFTFSASLPGGQLQKFVNYPSFVDIGSFLFGTTRFLTILGGEPDLAKALFDKCFELVTSCTEFLIRLEDETVNALGGFGGDNSCLLSPNLYKKYGISWDVKLLNYVKKKHNVSEYFPCNLHSCGPSNHLYELWGQHPCKENIKTMQTRLLPGKLEKLRKSLPHTFLSLTFHPQHFDFANVSAEKVRNVLLKSVEAVGYQNVNFKVFAIANHLNDLESLVKNIGVFYKTLANIIE